MRKSRLTETACYSHVHIKLQSQYSGTGSHKYKDLYFLYDSTVAQTVSAENSVCDEVEESFMNSLCFLQI